MLTEDRSGRLKATAGGLVAASCASLIAGDSPEASEYPSEYPSEYASLEAGESPGASEEVEEVEVCIIKERDDNGDDRKLGLVLSTSHEIPKLHISVIRKDGLAARTLLRVGDRVLEVNGVSVHHSEEATAVMMQATPSRDSEAVRRPDSCVVASVSRASVGWRRPGTDGLAGVGVCRWTWG